jgi:hypothetical protein
MKIIAKTLHVLAIAYLTAASLFIVASYAAVFWFEGWWKLSELLSPFNVINWAVTVATLAPGVALQIASERVAARI